jgi:hypothetical protein
MKDKAKLLRLAVVALTLCFGNIATYHPAQSTSVLTADGGEKPNTGG